MKKFFAILLPTWAVLTPASAQDWAMGGYDPVAFSSGRFISGQANISTLWQDRIWYFVSAGNRSKFEANPREYAPVFDGYCPVALAEGRKVSGDPRYFAVIENRIYLVNSAQDLQSLMQFPAEFLAKANINWFALR